MSSYGGYRSGKSSKMTSSDHSSPGNRLFNVLLYQNTRRFFFRMSGSKIDSLCKTQGPLFIKVHYLRRELPHLPALKRSSRVVLSTAAAETTRVQSAAGHGI